MFLDFYQKILKREANELYTSLWLITNPSMDER
jgi:hypothetical protein